MTQTVTIDDPDNGGTPDGDYARVLARGTIKQTDYETPAAPSAGTGEAAPVLSARDLPAPFEPKP